MKDSGVAKILRAAAALVAGVLTGTIENVILKLLPRFVDEAVSRIHHGYLLSDHALMDVTIYFSIVFGAMIALLATPVWLLASQFGLNRPVHAALLGFLATVTFWILLENLGQTLPDSDPMLHGFTFDTFQYGLAGAVAGLVTWRVSHPKSR